MDLRIKRTRLFIREAFFNLILEKGFDSVTVVDIAERAIINRSTFYRHYQDKYDLAKKCLDEPFNALLEQLDQMESKQDLSDSNPPKTFLLLFEHIEQNAELYRELFGRNGTAMFVSCLRGYIIQLLRHRLRDVPWSGREGLVPLDMFEEYLAGAYIGVIQWWLENLENYPAQKVALCLYRLVVQGTDSALGFG